MQRQKEAEDRRGRRHDDDSRRHHGKDREGSSRRRSRSRSPKRSSNQHSDRRDRSDRSDRHRSDSDRHRDKDRGLVVFIIVYIVTLQLLLKCRFRAAIAGIIGTENETRGRVIEIVQRTMVCSELPLP